MRAGFSNDTIFEKELQRFRVAGFHEVLVVLKNKLDFAVTQSSIPDERKDAIRNGDLAPHIQYPIAV